MKIFIYSLIIAILGYLLRDLTPWWSIAIIAGIAGALARLSGIRAFFMGFLGAALLWGVYTFFVNMQNEGTLASKIGELFGNMSPIGLILITALLGGFIGGMGALTGQLGRSLFLPPRR